MESTPTKTPSLIMAAAMLAACASIGPRTVTVDRFDMPVFVDVSSIVAGYSLQTGVSVNGVVASEKAVQGNYGALGAQGVYTDRPTITYVPMTGGKFLRGLVTPIEPRNIFFMMQAGYPANFILGLAVESMNGVRNRAAAGGVGLRVAEDKARGSTPVLFFRRDDLPEDIQEKSAEIRRLLKLPADQQKFVLACSPMRGAANELAVNSRSMLQILQAFSGYVDAPEQHVREGRAGPAFEHAPAGEHNVGRIRSGTTKPERAYAAVHYEGYWFWVDDSDWQAKWALTTIMFLFTLADTGGPERLPLVTIPAQ